MTTPTLTSQVPAVVDYLVTKARASTLLGAAQPVPVTVYDGPTVDEDRRALGLALWIGWNPLASGAEAMVSAMQDWAVIDRGRTRDEDGEILCAADAWSGSDVLKAQRDACAGVVAQVELMLRGDPLSGAPGDYSMGGLALWSQVAGPFDWIPRQTQSGAGMTCTFKITYRARLTTTP